MTRMLAAALALAVLVAACAATTGSLAGPTWQWTGSTTTTPASQSVVPDPQNYTIQFKPDQTFSGKADCNQIAGTWTSTEGDGITITVGPSTMAACGPDSLAPTYLAGLDKATAYGLESSSKLTLVLGTEGTMAFK